MPNDSSFGNRRVKLSIKVYTMKRSFAPLFFAGLVSGLALVGCDSSSPSPDSGSVSLDTSATEQTKVETVALPTDATGLQNEMVSSFAAGNESRFNQALTAYVNDISDRRAQRDFANEIWNGSDNYEMNREMAVPLVEALSNAYDSEISAPTYLAGFAYWAGSGAEKDLGKALEYWAKPGVDGNAAVHYRRAVIYLDAALPYYDASKGRALMTRAATMGNPDAAKWLKENP